MNYITQCHEKLYLWCDIINLVIFSHGRNSRKRTMVKVVRPNQYLSSEFKLNCRTTSKNTEQHLLKTSFNLKCHLTLPWYSLEQWMPIVTITFPHSAVLTPRRNQGIPPCQANRQIKMLSELSHHGYVQFIQDSLPGPIIYGHYLYQKSCTFWNIKNSLVTETHLQLL